MGLSAPSIALPTVELGSATCPILSLLDYLADTGFRPVRHNITHNRACREYDERQVLKRRRYLQCVAACEELLSKGAQPFDKLQSQAFYSLLLRRPGDQLTPGLAASVYLQRLADQAGDIFALGIRVVYKHDAAH